MNARVILTALHGLPPGTMFVFSGPASCVLGRANDCDLHVPNDEAHRTVSRHHCLLAANPPLLWVRDLDSKNGTYVNAVNISRGAAEASAGTDAAPRPAVYELEEGDALQLGNVLLTVHVLDEEERVAPRATQVLRRRGCAAPRLCVKK